VRRFLAFLCLLLGPVPALAPAQGQPAARTGNLVIDFLDVGQGDSILIRSPEGKTALIDAGPSHEVVSLLKGRGVTSIGLVAVSHHHADHYGGMEAVIRAFRPRLFLATNSSHTTPHYLSLLRLVRDSGMQAVSPTDSTRTINLGSVVLTVLPQPPEDKAEENNNSIGIRVQYGDFSALLTGDSEARERAYWERNVPQFVRGCTVLKLAHHGSRNGTDARWLGLVRPQLAVASVGRGNEFGHPHPETLALLARYRIPLSRTDIDGTVTVVSDGRRWGVSRHPQPVRAPPDSEERVGVAGRETKHPGGTKNSHRLVNINTASQNQLEALPEIGEVIARRIIQGRPYLTVDDLRRVEGIGEKRLEEIRPRVTAR
jgi:competence protein ComEC